MIEHRDGSFILTTRDSLYAFGILPTGHLEHLYYGRRCSLLGLDTFRAKLTAGYGTSITIPSGDGLFYPDCVPLEWSGSGRGDFRHSPVELVMPDGSFVSEFRYASHAVTKGTVPLPGLPASYGGPDECESLVVTLRDALFPVELDLVYTVYPEENVIARRTTLRNLCDRPVVVKKLMSLSFDTVAPPVDILTLDGGWIKESHANRRPVARGLVVNDSTTGASGNRHNPAFALVDRRATEDAGECWGVNLVYSGNHYGAVELSAHGVLRAMIGVNPHDFSWPVPPGESFRAPEAVMTWSGSGLNGMSANFHDFVNTRITRGPWRGRERPVLANNWEATFFDFTESRIVSMAREAKKLGAELFVLDDGWFGARNSDRAGLGDYSVNRKKLPRGLSGLAKKIRALGLDFGLWFEPEMVSEDSDLFRARPDWAVRVPGRESARGRNQLALDLTRAEVRDYIVGRVNATLASADISYVKWDMNRHLTDAFSSSLPDQGMFFHAHTLGLYDVLSRVTAANPNVLLESCSSGGNRFDLGMLCFSQQAWASDDTDPGERLKIQEGLSYFYPLSAIGAHVSQSPHQQTLRRTSLATRFAVASFGVLGLELDPAELDAGEKREIAARVAYYKKRRAVFQYGRFFRFDRGHDNVREFEVVERDGRAGARSAVYGFFQTVAEAAPPMDVVFLKGLERDSAYRMETLPSTVDIRELGSLLKHALPVRVNPHGILLNEAGKHYRLECPVERHVGTGDQLSCGVKLAQRFTGLGHNGATRLLTDFGSELYDIERMEAPDEK